MRIVSVERRDEEGRRLTTFGPGLNFEQHSRVVEVEIELGEVIAIRRIPVPDNIFDPISSFEFRVSGSQGFRRSGG